jgi:formate dehydrogenase accessory protein FdhE
MPTRAPDLAERCRSLWSARIARARTLAEAETGASDLLTFYAGLAEQQQGVIENPALGDATPGRHPTSDVPFRDALDIEPGLRAIPALLTWLSRHAPASLAERAAGLEALDRAAWERAARSYLATDGHRAEDMDEALIFVVGAVLQPLAERYALERLAGAGSETTSARLPAAEQGGCAICGGRPILGVLREEGQGAKRTLVCALCLSERDYLRVVCPRCGEQKFDALPVYTAEQFAHIRVEACDSCRAYLKTIDLTKDGLAVPLVDDIASVSLDLWARERGYDRLSPNVLMI